MALLSQKLELLNVSSQCGSSSSEQRKPLKQNKTPCQSKTDAFLNLNVAPRKMVVLRIFKEGRKDLGET